MDRMSLSNRLSNRPSEPMMIISPFSTRTVKDYGRWGGGEVKLNFFFIFCFLLEHLWVDQVNVSRVEKGN